MRKFGHISKRLISFLLAFIIAFPMFSGVLEVHADPSITKIRFTRVYSVTTKKTTEALSIHGSGFTNPVVMIDGEKAVISSRSDENTIIIEDGRTLGLLYGKESSISVTTKNDAGVSTTDTMSMDLSKIPSIEGITAQRAYVGTPLEILGNQFEGLSYPNDILYVAGTPYQLGTAECTVSDGVISIPRLKSSNAPGLSNIRIERTINGADGSKNEIYTIYDDSITVVNQLTGIEVERVDPNAGPKDRKNLVSIYGKSPSPNFTEGLRIFVGESEGVNKGVIKNAADEPIGVRFELPTRANAGVVDLVLKSQSLSSEYVIPNGFIYLDIGNALSIDEDGINPNFKKETEDKIVEITGRNIGFFNGTGYDITDVSAVGELKGYSPYGTSGKFNDITYYKVKYTAKYKGKDVTILREFKFTIDGDATVVDMVYGGVDYKPVFTESLDTVYVSPADVNLNPNEPKSVDVAVRTVTTIFTEPGGVLDEIIYSRIEDYVVKNGFTYYPDEITPEITSVTPGYGPSSKDIYMSIKGKDFQVYPDGTLPKVTIGGRVCTGVRVYDDNNNVVDGRIITVGTKIKCILPGNVIQTNGAVDVIVTNPSGGRRTLTNGFEFRNEGENREVTITSVKNDYADLRGGVVSGETVVITGNNFDTSADNNHRVLITIDGEKATIVGRVSSDGKSVTIIPPPGTIPGMTKLQLINEDGSMATADFEYRRITSNPKITSLVPSKGGKGSKLVIKGEDFILPDKNVDANDPKRKGTVVLLGGMELNAYNYNADGSIAENADGSIYYYNPAYDPDGSGGAQPYVLVGEMVKVIDSTTIYVDLPDKFYRFGGTSAPYLLSENIPLGNLKVEVVNPDGARSKEEVFFNYLRPATNPEITSMSPNSGSIAGGTVVTLTGVGFKEENLEVYFGPEKAANIDFINPTQVRVTVPRYPYPVPANVDEFIVPVMLVNYDGGTAVREGADGFIYKVPSSNPIITGLYEMSEDEKRARITSGSSAGGDEIIFEGVDFRRESIGGSLPDVYFNGVKAKVRWSPQFEDDLIAEQLIVTIPASTVSGPVDIVLVNYDAGSCTYKGFSYSMSRPAITSVTPSTVSYLGNVNLEIKGTGFRQGNLQDLFQLPGGMQEQVGRHTDNPTDAADVIKTKVIFGSEFTGDKKIIDTIIGPYSKTIGDLKFVYEKVGQDIARISVLRVPGDAPVIRQLKDDSGNVVPTPMSIDIPIGSSHMFILNHAADLGNSLCFDEGILIETTNESVVITRRLAPYADVRQNNTKIVATAPPIGDEGSRNLYVVNDDNGTASAGINVVSPDSNPTIISIEPVNHGKLAGVVEPYNPANAELYSELYTYVPADGGAFLTIKGSDYRRNVKVYLEDKLLEIVSKSANDDELVVKVPPGTANDLEKLYRIIIVNEDGGVADSSLLDQPYFVIYKESKSHPVVESIVPNYGSGGSPREIIITGYNFEAGVVVSLDGVPCTTVRDQNKPGEILHVTVPAGMSPGKKLVMVQNGDYGYTEIRDGYTVISSPHIESVLNSKGEIIDPVVFSIEGGEKVQLKGAGFMTGARVILGGVVKPKSELAEGETGIEGLSADNIDVVIVGGIQISDAQVSGNDTISFTTPKLVTSETSIVVINTDGGVSNLIDADYEKPRPDRPKGLEAEAVDGDTIRLEWDKVEGAIYYELYVSISENGRKIDDYKYLASVIPEELDNGRVVYFVEDLLTETYYSFKIRAANHYTFSKFTEATKYVLTGDEIRNTSYQGTDEFLTAMKEDKVIFRGSEIIYTAGEKSLDSAEGVKADFDKQYYGAATRKSIEMNFLDIKKYQQCKLFLKDKDIEISMMAVNLGVDEAIMVSSTLHKDTRIKLSINRNLASRGDDVRISVPKGYKLLSNPFGIEVTMQVQKDVISVRSLRGEAEMTLKYDEGKAAIFPGGVYIAYYDSYERKLQIIQTEKLKGALRAKISRSGEYMILGKMTK